MSKSVVNELSKGVKTPYFILNNVKIELRGGEGE